MRNRKKFNQFAGRTYVPECHFRVLQVEKGGKVLRRAQVSQMRVKYYYSFRLSETIFGP